MSSPRQTTLNSDSQPCPPTQWGWSLAVRGCPLLCGLSSGTPQKSQGPLPSGGGEQNQHTQPRGSWSLWNLGQRQNSPRLQLGQTPQGTPSAS